MGAERTIENDLGNDDIKRLVYRLAIPSTLAQFVNVLYSVVDRIYIGNIPEIGELALGGVGVSAPIVQMVLGFAYMIGMGGSPLMSIRMGQGNNEEAKKIMANSFMMLMVIAGFLMATLIPAREWILYQFGASEITYPYAETYFVLYMTGTAFALIATGMNQFVICQGFARVGMISVTIGAATNIILDPIFIFVFHMGVAGAAIATVISQFVSASYVIAFLMGKRVPVRLSFGGYEWRLVGKITVMGLSPFFIMAFDSVLVIALNTAIKNLGGDNADMMLTCNAIVQSFIVMVNMPLGGITAGTGAILGFNLGAGKPERIKEAQKYIFVLAFIFCVIMFAVSRLGGRYFVYMFTRNPEYVNLAIWALGAYTWGVIPLSLQYGIVDGFTGMGLPALAMPLAVIRKSLFLVSVVVIPHFASVENIFYAESICDIGSMIISTIVYFLVMGKILRKCGEAGKQMANAERMAKLEQKEE